jgi:enoyl-CoA hydratase/carnithine racemase
LTLNRPEKRNALDTDLCRSLIQAVHDAASDRAVGAILLDAAGKDFCSGMDLNEALGTDVEHTLALHQGLFSVGVGLGKPLVAAVQGAALAGGLGLALNAHVVVGAADSRYGLTERRIGLWPYFIFPVVAAAVGERKATELALTSRIVGAEEARAIGLVDIVVASESLSESARELALDLAMGSAEAVSDGLAFVAQRRERRPDATAAAFRKRAIESADYREGVLAFLEKRKPRWPSHGTKETVKA